MPHPFTALVWPCFLCCLERVLCGIAPILFAALAWLGSYAVSSACCLALPLSCLQRLLGLALLLFRALAVRHCPYPPYAVSGGCLAFSYAVDSACCVALPLSALSCLQRLLGLVLMLFTALAWHCFYAVYSACLARLSCRL